MAKAAVRVGPLVWQDTAAGVVAADPLAQGDVVIARKDAAASYHLASVVDDAAQGVSLVVRGRDLFEATHIHRLLQALLGLPAPDYRHHPLAIGADGERLAKRNGAISLVDLRAQGMEGGKLAEMMRQARFPFGFALEDA
jgi:glutamyl-Q tRNA(Asp) synthetase